jgi:hypothetical protein
MRSPRERTRRLVLLLNSVDRFGRIVEPPVLSVAQEIASQAVSHGEKLLGDPALALTLFEEVAATVSKTIGEKLASGKPAIRGMRNYLFRAYLRRISIKKTASLSLDHATDEQWESHALRTHQRDIERQILLRQPNKTYSSRVAGLGKLLPPVLGCSIHEHSSASRCFVESDSTVAAASTA